MKCPALVRIFVLVGSLSALAAADSSAGWRAGVATRVITPTTETWLAGYAARTHPSTGTIQDLHAKALAVADAEGGRFVFLTIDAIGIPRSLRLAVARQLAEKAQLRAEQFVITASHTHSGPEFRAGRVPEHATASVTAAQAYLAMLETTLSSLAIEALAALSPAKFSYTRARAGFAMNRRLPQANGSYTNAPNPDGPVDHDVPVLRVDGSDGKLRAVLFGYACHNTTLTQTNYQFCGDYAGYAQAYLEKDHPGVTALFVTGCGGDQNPYPRSTLPLAEAHGRTLATAVDAALSTRAKTLGAGALRSAYGEIDLRYAEVPNAAEFQQRIAGKDKALAEHGGRMLERLKREGALPTTYPYPVQVVQLGPDLKFVALGGEVVVDYSLRLKRELGGPANVWVAGYSNDVLGYIPNERVLREGGYEGEQASRLGSLHPSPWAPGLEDQIVNKVHDLVRAVTAGR